MKWQYIGLLVLVCVVYYWFTRREHMTTNQLLNTLKTFREEAKKHPQGIANPPAPVESIMNGAHIKS
uniref:Uncharacterized protein n=1 Tax=viral metagenome TaxID=1070528 RepID=A0A6C0CJQ7_9ZZZZ